jgi:protein O-GlcNAcase/histone acetyltransferase
MRFSLRIRDRLLVWLSVACLFAPFAAAQEVEWAEPGGGSQTEYGYGIGLDGAGNSYITGFFEGTADFGEFTLTAEAGRDLYVVKCDDEGVVQWAVRMGGADYLDTIGRDLIGEIDVFWTGPAIISEEIPAKTIDALAKRIGRKPVIWDNLHANDYDQRRLFCGPYSRSNDLRDSVRGILSNPNNEFPIDFIPLRTLGDYLNEESYDPRTAYLAAAKDWSKHFTTITSQVSYDSVVLLADCHYLPFSDGDEARKLEVCIAKLLDQPAESWGGALVNFESFHDRVDSLFEQLSQMNDRELFYAWSRRIWDLKEELDLISDFAKAKRNGELSDDGFASESHLPSIWRGGFVANLQRRLKMNDQGRFETT